MAHGVYILRLQKTRRLSFDHNSNTNFDRFSKCIYCGIFDEKNFTITLFFETWKFKKATDFNSIHCTLLSVATFQYTALYHQLESAAMPWQLWEDKGNVNRQLTHYKIYLPTIDDFQYLGSYILIKFDTVVDIQARLTKAAYILSLIHIWRCRRRG